MQRTWPILVDKHQAFQSFPLYVWRHYTMRSVCTCQEFWKRLPNGIQRARYQPFNWDAQNEGTGHVHIVHVFLPLTRRSICIYMFLFLSALLKNSTIFQVIIRFEVVSHLHLNFDVFPRALVEKKQHFFFTIATASSTNELPTKEMQLFWKIKQFPDHRIFRYIRYLGLDWRPGCFFLLATARPIIKQCLGSSFGKYTIWL